MRINVNKFLILMLFIYSSILVADDKNEYSINLFCQDLNVILERVSVHSYNIANHQTTRTENGTPFRRKIIDHCLHGQCLISEDQTPPILKYRPGHPDANENGFVAYPDFSIDQERAKLIKAQNAYDLVVGNMPISSVNLLVGNKWDECFSKYIYFKEQFDFKTYLGRK